MVDLDERIRPLCGGMYAADSEYARSPPSERARAELREGRSSDSTGAVSTDPCPVRTEIPWTKVIARRNIPALGHMRPEGDVMTIHARRAVVGFAIAAVLATAAWDCCTDR